MNVVHNIFPDRAFKKSVLVLLIGCSAGLGQAENTGLRERIDSLRDSVERLDHQIHEAMIAERPSEKLIDSLKFAQKKIKQNYSLARHQLQAWVETQELKPETGSLGKWFRVIGLILLFSLIFVAVYSRRKRREQERIKDKMDRLAKSQPVAPLRDVVGSLAQVAEKHFAVSPENFSVAKKEENRGNILRLAKRGATASEISQRLRLSREEVELVIRHELESKG